LAQVAVVMKEAVTLGVLGVQAVTLAAMEIQIYWEFGNLFPKQNMMMRMVV
jgi:hypothetical protein